jgi:hypothetical protein
MAGQIQQVYVNSVRFGFQDLTVEGETGPQFGALPFAFPKGCFQSINWEAAQDHGEVQGNRITSMGVTDGYGTVTGDFELLVSEADDWEKLITGGGAFPLMTVFFDLRLVMTVNQGIDVRTVELIGVLCKNNGAGNQKGNDAATQKYQFRAGNVAVNGIYRFADPT